VSHPDPFVTVKRLWARIDTFRAKIESIERQVDHEVGRLARTRHRNVALNRLYWNGRERIEAARLARLFGLPVLKLAQHAGPISTEAQCVDCGANFVAVVASRTTLMALTNETDSATPTHRVCPGCRALRDHDLAQLRRQKGTKLTPENRLAYFKYLRSDGWRARRKAALKRAKNRCQLCATTEGLDAHHRTYRRLGAERPDDVTVLCRFCHKLHHGH
jgi:hypothetical protein